MLGSLKSQNRPQIIVLPECFNSFYRHDDLRRNAEAFDSPVDLVPTIAFLKQFSLEHQVYLITSIPEYDLEGD